MKKWSYEEKKKAIQMFEELTVVELKAALKKRGLPSTGKKSELVQRIAEDSEKFVFFGWPEEVNKFIFGLMAIMFIATLLFDPEAIYGCIGWIVFFFWWNAVLADDEYAKKVEFENMKIR